MAHRKLVPEENKDLVPNGEDGCYICCLPRAELEAVNKLHTEKKLNVYQICKRIQVKHQYTISRKSCAAHFRRHIHTSKSLLLTKSSKNPIVSEILQVAQGAVGSSKNDVQIEKAYNLLVKMSAMFTERVKDCFDVLPERFKDKEELRTYLLNQPHDQLLRSLAELNRMARDQVKDIAALRAPKVMVMQFLEDSFDRTILEINQVLSNLFVMIQDELIKLGKDHELPLEITDDTFRNSFKRVATMYKERMTILRHEQLKRASAALADLEKVV
jgi:hypothetical protein